MARDFRKIITWQKADDLAMDVYKYSAQYFPAEEKFGLTSQLRSAPLSVPANIAEGSVRNTLKDFLRFLYFAQGSLSEVEYYLHFVKRLEYIDQDTYSNLEAQRAELGRTLNGFINSIKNKVAKGETT
ncbi:MAG: four helix bundle protein [Anaerolineales bacterium]|nr:four helix bundle protein [Chloroflexota bacterium]MBL6980072.1 four helix bundle protein [Anaerolineales bacterium]